MKFLDTVNKREYVRVCSRKPRCKPMNSLRYVQSADLCYSAVFFKKKHDSSVISRSLFWLSGVFR